MFFYWKFVFSDVQVPEHIWKQLEGPFRKIWGQNISIRIRIRIRIRKKNLWIRIRKKWVRIHNTGYSILLERVNSSVGWFLPNHFQQITVHLRFVVSLSKVWKMTKKLLYCRSLLFLGHKLRYCIWGSHIFVYNIESTGRRILRRLQKYKLTPSAKLPCKKLFQKYGFLLDGYYLWTVPVLLLWIQKYFFGWILIPFTSEFWIWILLD
jgi:hypothetical protein